MTEQNGGKGEIKQKAGYNQHASLFLLIRLLSLAEH